MRRHFPFLVILLCGALFGLTSATERYDLKLLDFQFKLLRAWFPRPVTRDVVVIGVDEDTAKRFREPITLWHGHLGQLLGAMAQARPAVLGIDIVLPDRSYEAVLPGTDKLLMKGMLEARRSYPLVLALTLDPSGKPRPVHPPFLTLAGPGGAGYALFPVDRDGVVRRYDERLGEHGEPVPTLPGQMARHLRIEPRAGVIDYWRGAPFEYVPLRATCRRSSARSATNRCSSVPCCHSPTGSPRPCRSPRGNRARSIPRECCSMPRPCAICLARAPSGAFPRRR
jgi:hypothetical protein